MFKKIVIAACLMMVVGVAIGAATNNLTPGQRVANQTVDNFQVITGSATNYFSLPSGTATAISASAVLNTQTGIITSESLSTSAGSTYTLTVNNNQIYAGDVVLASASLGSATSGVPLVETVTPANGSVAILIKNNHSTDAFNGTIKVAFASH